MYYKDSSIQIDGGFVYLAIKFLKTTELVYIHHLYYVVIDIMHVFSLTVVLIVGGMTDVVLLIIIFGVKLFLKKGKQIGIHWLSVPFF
jgi:hypothetical protein